MTDSNFKAILVRIGAEPYSYSGRGMYGKKCLGVDLSTDEINQKLIAWLCEMQQSPVDDPIYDIKLLDVSKMINRAHGDAMGLGRVSYWPWIS